MSIIYFLFDNLWSLWASVIIVVLLYYVTEWLSFQIDKRKYYYEKEKESLSASNSTCGLKPAACNPGTINAQKQWWHDARIYHVLIDRFYGWKEHPVLTKVKPDAFAGGTLKGIRHKLKYIQEQGYNTIMISPPFASNAYHGYHITDYTEIDKSFGTWSDFYDLVNAVHERGMRIICDYVPNHCHKSNKLFKEAINSDMDSEKRQMFFFKKGANEYTTFLGYPDLPKFNLKNKEATDYMINVAMMLVYAGVDGLRIDHVIGLPFEFLERLCKSVKDFRPDVFIFGEATATGIKKEHVSQLYLETESLRKDIAKSRYSRDDLQLQYVNILDGILDFEFRDIVIRAIKRKERLYGNLDLVRKLDEHFRNYPPNFSPVLFLDNHDTNRLTYICDICDGKTELALEAINFTKNLPFPVTIYYGTEQYMTHEKPVNEPESESYSDLQCRVIMNW